jgi:uncharacterized NAD-dependent epimerase/dehydratase family protein
MLIQKPYLLFLGDVEDQAGAKMAYGIAFWTPQNVAGKLRLPNCKADVPAPELSIAEAAAKGAKTLVVGVVNAGGFIPESWQLTLRQAIEAGMDIASGMHTRLREIPGLEELAQKHGRQLIDVREPQRKYPVGNGKKRSGKRLLTVGTDCSVGKMFTTLAIEREMHQRGQKATFRATGQTGIMIAGDGVPVDAIVSDFISGCVEILTPDNQADHWDLIEGQGSLFHPSFAGVSLGLLHGSQADALVMCHHASRKGMRGTPHYALPDIKTCVDFNLAAGKLTNPAIQCIGFSVNTSELSEKEAFAYLETLEKELGKPCVDPLRNGVGRFVDVIEKLT